MSDTPELPELEPLEEAAAPPSAAPPPAAAGGVMPVSLAGMPAPAFGMRAQKQYYRFLFAGVVMLLGCLMPFGPEWQMAGYKTLGGSIFTIISLGIVWSSWVAISHGKFDLSNMRWLILATVPFVVMLWHLIFIFEEPAVQAYIEITKKEYPETFDQIVIQNWSEIFDRLRGFRTPELSRTFDNFVRAYGPGKIILLLGSAYALMHFVLGIGAGIKAGKAQKAAREAERSQRKRR